MSPRDNDQPADERDWAAAVIAAADEPFDPVGSDADPAGSQDDDRSTDDEPTPVEAERADSDSTADTNDDPLSVDEGDPFGTELDGLDFETDPEFVDAAEPATSAEGGHAA